VAIAIDAAQAYTSRMTDADRITELEKRVAELEEQVAELECALGILGRTARASAKRAHAYRDALRQYEERAGTNA
jgi:uncharacterized coiled-coil protein SlyX